MKSTDCYLGMGTNISLELGIVCSGGLLVLVEWGQMLWCWW